MKLGHRKPGISRCRAQLPPLARGVAGRYSEQSATMNPRDGGDSEQSATVRLRLKGRVTVSNQLLCVSGSRGGDSE